MSRQFGRIPSPIDNRDWDIRCFEPKRVSIAPGQWNEWEFPCVPLDQEESPHCVGFGGAHFGINLPTFTVYTKQDAHDLYYKCKVVDGEPGAENGTTIRSIAKVLQDIGAINNYAFARDIESIKWWLVNKGPLILGVIWTENMMTPDENGLLDIGGFILGGHCVLANGLMPDGRIKILNSWGPEWGINGEAYLTEDDFKAIFYYGGEALSAVELENYKIKREHWFIRLIKRILESLKRT